MTLTPERPAAESTGGGRTQHPAADMPHAAAAPASALPSRASGTPSPVRAPRPAGEGAKTSRPAGSPSHLPGGASTSPRDRVRTVAGTEAGGGGGGGTRDAAEIPLPAGSTGRTYTITLPAGMELLSLNDRLHWSERARRSQALKEAAWALARQAKIPPLSRVAVVAEYQPPDRRRRDSDNIAVSVKAAIDGCVIAGCLPGDDSPRYVESVTCRIGEPYPKGRLVLHLIEVAAAPERPGAA